MVSRHEARPWHHAVHRRKVSLFSRVFEFIFGSVEGILSCAYASVLVFSHRSPAFTAIFAFVPDVPPCPSAYIGLWENDHPHGRGVMAYPSGAEYDGNWEFGRRHGSGWFLYADKGSYEGMWADDLRNGKGLLKYSNGDEYKGARARGSLPLLA